MSAAEPITFFILFDNVCTAPFPPLVFLKFWEPMKKCHYAFLRPFISNGYDVLQLILSIMSLVLQRRFSFWSVTQ